MNQIQNQHVSRSGDVVKVLKWHFEIWPDGVVRSIIADSHSVDPGSNPGRVIFCSESLIIQFFQELIFIMKQIEMGDLIRIHEFTCILGSLGFYFGKSN